MKSFYLTLVIILFFISTGIAQALELKFKTHYSELDSEYTYTFDEKVISKKILSKYFEINPTALKTSLKLAPALNLCIADDPKYPPCGRRNIYDKNFYKIAIVNINLAKDSLEYLYTFNEIKELKPLVEHCINSLQFSLWLNETKYKFFQSWNTDDLKRSYQDIDPKKVCPDIIQKIDDAKNIDKKYKFVNYKWNNALNREFRDDLNYESLIMIWNDFLEIYNIKEKIVSEEP